MTEFERLQNIAETYNYKGDLASDGIEGRSRCMPSIIENGVVLVDMMI